MWPSGQKQPSASPLLSKLWFLPGQEGVLGPPSMQTVSEGGSGHRWSAGLFVAPDVPWGWVSPMPGMGSPEILGWRSWPPLQCPAGCSQTL